MVQHVLLPLVAAPLLAVSSPGPTFAAGHAAGPYDAALDNDPVHVLEHATYVVTGLWSWQVVLGARGPVDLGDRAGRGPTGFGGEPLATGVQPGPTMDLVIDSRRLFEILVVVVGIALFAGALLWINWTIAGFGGSR